MSSFTLLPAGESSDFAADVRLLFEDPAAHLARERRAYSGECHPSLDVRETADAVGDKQMFHLVEREFGRFARAVPIGVALDAGRANATLADGELTVHLPNLADRLGAPHRIRVRRANESDTSE
jgi:hypothetical protein